ncbi:YcaO-like family protein [Polymorphospora rubra]|uniref:YcaO-like family protein n=1 Tax=Polymorphospora rubra TaxID=338584 RepID=UPI0033F214B5
MIDISATLDARNGLSRTFAIGAPRPPVELLWQTVVELDRPGDPDDESLPPSARYVGAGAYSRSDSVLRGAGEAVERAALHPARGTLEGTVRGRRADLGPAALAYDRPDLALGAPGTADHELTWYPARRLRDGAPLLVPAGLVDWPCADDEAPTFDPGPSGAASGAGYDMALRNALLEMIERDAVMVAWERGLHLPRIAPPESGTGPTGRAVAALLSTAAAAGLRVVLARVPTAFPDLCCGVAVVVDEWGGGRAAAVGCKVSEDPARSVLGALQEGLQVRGLLRNTRGDGPPPDVPARIHDENDRVAFMLATEGTDSIVGWTADFTPPTPLSAGRARRPTVDDLVAGLVADGADPLVVDLTARLPARIRAMGWAAVKVVPAGYQHLRMDEEKDWSWNRPRLATAEARTGLVATFAPGQRRRPHPLP